MSPGNSLCDVPDGYEAGKAEAQRVATHVLARARHQATGRFGLVAGNDGIATPAFGDDDRTVRIAPDALVSTRAGATTSVPWPGASLRALAVAAGTDLDAPFSAGADTPDVGDPDAALALDARVLSFLACWFAFGWTALELAIAALGTDGEPAAIQLWPEHFDAATDVAVGPRDGDRVNLGASPGDGFHLAPYLYVGPWGSERPGDDGYWNAPFGAMLTHEDLRGEADPSARAVAFLLDGVRRCGGTSAVPSPA